MAIVVSTGLFGQSYAFQRTDGAYRRWLARHFNKTGNRKDRALIAALLGAAAGATATATRARIAHSTTELGGKRTMETQTLINRATTAQDDTDLTAQIFSYASQPTSYPVDKATRA
jgi:hypothetical protein